MKSPLLIILIYILCCCACDPADQIMPGKKYSFHHAEILDEKTFVINTDTSLSEFDANTGQLGVLKMQVLPDLYNYIRSQQFGNYLESFEIFKDSVRLNLWQNGNIFSEMFLLQTNGELLIDEQILDAKIHWDNTHSEINFNLIVQLGIINRNNIPFPEINYDFSNETDLHATLQEHLANHDYEINDTLGIYRLKMVYKE